jgi:hypothetical protein
MWTRKIQVFLCIFLLLTIAGRPAGADGNPLAQAQGLVGSLNPINLALGPLIDQAISDGNTALAQRLEQLRSIIQEALFNLNKIIKDATITLNSDAEARLEQLNRDVSSNLQLFQAIAAGQTDMLNDAAEQRIQQFGNTTANLVAALPIPSQPLPNVPATGFSLVKSQSQYTTFFVTGAGFLKGGVTPTAYLLNGDSSDTHYFSHNGIGLKVKSASMGLIEIEVPSTLFPSTGQMEKTLVLKMRSWSFLPISAEPSFPLLLCSKLPKYSLRVTQQAVGQFWDRRVVDYPTYTNPATKEYYIDDGGSNKSFDICADAADTQEWKSDPDVAHYGLEYAGLKEHVGATLPNLPRNGCVHLYAGHDSSGGGFAKAWGIVVHQRRLKQGSCGDTLVLPAVDLKYGSVNSIPTKPQELLERCVQTSAGAATSPTIQTHVDLVDEQGKVADQVNLTPLVPSRLDGGAATVTVDSLGLIKVALTTRCSRQI